MRSQMVILRDLSSRKHVAFWTCLLDMSHVRKRYNDRIESNLSAIVFI